MGEKSSVSLFGIILLRTSWDKSTEASGYPWQHSTITWAGTVDEFVVTFPVPFFLFSGHVVTSSGWKVNTTTHIPCCEHGAYELLRSRYQHIICYKYINNIIYIYNRKTTYAHACFFFMNFPLAETWGSADWTKRDCDLTFSSCMQCPLPVLNDFKWQWCWLVTVY